MNGYLTDIEKLTKENSDFRRVLYTAPTSQLVLMCLKPGEEIGEEVHTLDQFFRVEEGEGKAYMNGTVHRTKADAEADTADHFDGATTEAQ